MALEITDAALKKRGQRARQRAQDRAPTARIRPEDWYPEIRVMLDEGMDKAQVERATHLSQRRINEILAGTSALAGLESAKLGSAKDPSSLSGDLQAMLPFTADAFELFFNRFAEYPTGLQPLHKSWIAAFIANYNLLLNVPPRHAKSTIFSVWLPIWLLCRNRDEQILIASAGEKLAKIFCYQIEMQLRLNVKLVAAFGHFAPANAKDGVWSPRSGELIVQGRSRENRTGQFSILCRGAGQHILGIEATVVICDDPTSPVVSRSEREREKREEWLREQVLSRLEPESKGDAAGHVAVVGQRVHLHDLYGTLAEDVDEDDGAPIWHQIEQPMVLRMPTDDLGTGLELLWPGRFSWADVKRIRGRAGSANFACMYQQEPLPDDAAFVSGEELRRIRDLQRPLGVGAPDDAEQQVLPIVRVLSIDPSPTKWNAFVVADVVCSRNSFYAMVVDLGQWKGAAREMKVQINWLLNKYNPDYFIMERSAVSAWFQSETFYEEISHRCRVLPHFTGSNKWDPELGVLSLAIDIEAGNFSLPYGDEAAIVQTKLFEAQAGRFGHGYDDDILMALWFIKVNFKKLRPRGKGGGLTIRKKDSWSYLRREKKHTDDEKKRQATEWRKQHAGQFGLR